MTFDGLNQSELLAYVEGELDAAGSALIEQRVAEVVGGPEGQAAVAALRSMRQDRVVLRSAPEPAVPMDFVAELEPQLARPMLIESRPGRYRRAHRKKTRRTAQLRLVGAAAALLIVAGGTWWAIAELADGFSDWTNRLVATNQQDNDDVPPPGSDLIPSELTTVVLNDADPADSTVPSPNPVTDGESAPIGPSVLTANFQLVLHASSEEDAERTTASAFFAVLTDGGGADAVMDHGDHPGPIETTTPDGNDQGGAGGACVSGMGGVLVRNFSFEEVRAELNAIRLARRTAGDDDAPLIVGTDDLTGTEGGAPPNPRSDVASLLRKLRAERLDSDQRARVVTGDAALSPSYEEQLAFSDDGAAYVIAVPARKLTALLAQLRIAQERRTSLRPLGGGAEADRTAEATATQRWLEEYRLVQSFLKAVHDAEGRDARVLVPLVVEIDE